MESTFYLRELALQNFATFKNQVITFVNGFNAIIGETGSGKSLLLDALQFILGARADKKIVRKDTDFSLIEATFHCSDQEISSYLEREGFPFENNEVIIKRVIFKNGISKNYLNHMSCSLGLLKSFSQRYIDLVGQFENQKLLSSSYQRQLLDIFSHNEDLLQEMKNCFEEHKKCHRQYIELLHKQSEREQRLDYIHFQINEIQNLDPSLEDEKDLIQKKDQLIHFEKNQQFYHQVSYHLRGDHQSTGLLESFKTLKSFMSKNTTSSAHFMDEVIEIEEKLENILSEIESKIEDQYAEEDLELILDRLDLYQKIKQKFAGTTESILQSLNQFLQEKEMIENIEEDLSSLKRLVSHKEEQLKICSRKIHDKRLKYSKILAKELTSIINHLKMEGATINIIIEEGNDIQDHGSDKIYFVAETNKGEGYFPIKNIASGGELSRILLAVRKLLSVHDSISIFLFDEIDTGIGGETAFHIGETLANVAQSGQVIAITHLPQIAKFADQLLVVKKETFEQNQNTRTESRVHKVPKTKVLKEAQLMAQI